MVQTGECRELVDLGRDSIGSPSQKAKRKMREGGRKESGTEEEEKEEMGEGGKGKYMDSKLVKLNISRG